MLAVEKRRQQALIEVDLAALDELFDDDLVHIHAPGLIHNKAQLLQHTATRRAYLEITRGALVVRLLGDDVAIVTGPITNRLRTYGRRRRANARRSRHPGPAPRPRSRLGLRQFPDDALRRTGLARPMSRSPTFTLGKSFDTHGPIGPWLTTDDEIADPHDLRMRLTVNGEERQNSTTGDMIYNIWEQIAELTTVMTLMPGDILATGTPAGIGAPTRNWLRPGDVVRAEIEGLGAIENRVTG